jgi:hypothetical protein
MDDHSTHHWSEGLSPVIFAINTRTTHTTKKTPFELVFGQQPRSDMHYWTALHDATIDTDIQMDDLISDKTGPNDNQVIYEQSRVAKSLR